MKALTPCSKLDFVRHLGLNQLLHDNIKEATSPVMEVIADKTDRTYYMDSMGCAGYAIDKTGDLTSLYSTIKGQGKALVNDAINNGAQHLDCFDGFLPTFYKGMGFVETDRVDNWTKGAPQVIFMALKIKLDTLN